MENILYDSRFVTNRLLELPIIEVIWKEETAHMEIDEYTFEIKNIIRLFKENHCWLGLADTSKFLMPISPEVQEDFDQKVIPLYIEAGIKAIAFIASEDFISQMGLEQLLDEPGFRQISTYFFSDREEALKWLMRFK